MKKLNQFIKENGAFVYPTIVVWCVGLALVLSISKADIHLFSNRLNSPVADVFFRYYTQMGETIPFVVAGVILFFNVRKASFLLAVLLVETIISSSLKNFFRAERPKLFFEKLGIQLHVAEGVSLNSWNSFPSGHTMAAFAFLFGLASMIKNRNWKVVLFLLALLTGYSRIYLSQHFLQDTLAGSFIGVLVVSFLYPLFFDSKEWGNHSILRWKKTN